MLGLMGTIGLDLLSLQRLEVRIVPSSVSLVSPCDTNESLTLK